MARGKRKFMRKVKKVIDGDAIKVDRPVKGSKYIRLPGVNTPEKGQKGYAIAKRRLRNRIGGRKVWIKPVAKDKYGGIVAKIRKVRKDRK